MLHGYAFHVRYPRRREQTYVTCDAAHVAHDIIQSHRIGWRVTVELIPFLGEGALAVTTTVSDLREHLDVVQQEWFVIKDGVLSSK